MSTQNIWRPFTDQEKKIMDEPLIQFVVGGCPWKLLETWANDKQEKVSWWKIWKRLARLFRRIRLKIYRFRLRKKILPEADFMDLEESFVPLLLERLGQLDGLAERVEIERQRRQEEKRKLQLSLHRLNLEFLKLKVQVHQYEEKAKERRRKQRRLEELEKEIAALAEITLPKREVYPAEFPTAEVVIPASQEQPVEAAKAP